MLGGLVGSIKYTFIFSWKNYFRSIIALSKDPDAKLKDWLRKRNEENGFMGLVASVISATTAQLLANGALLDRAPWTASGAYIISLCLSIMAVIMVLHQTIFLNSIDFLPAGETLALILGIPSDEYDDVAARDSPKSRRRMRFRTIYFYLPQMVLTSSIFALFVGIGLTTIPPLWTRPTRDTWEDSQKIAVASIFGIAVASVAYIWSVTDQWIST